MSTLLLIIVLIFPKPVASGPTFPANATYYWTMDETSGNTRLDSVGEGHLAETTTAVASVAGKKSNAADWPPGTGTLESTIGFGDTQYPASVTLWVNVDNLPVAFGNIFSALNNDDPYIRVTSGGNIVAGSVTDGDLITGSLGALDTWHSIVLTISAGREMTLYIDSVSSGTGSLSIDPSGASWRFGAITALDAAIDEAAIFVRVLNQTEVNTIWNSSAGTFGP